MLKLRCLGLRWRGLLGGNPAAPVWLLAACCDAIGAAAGIAHARLSEPFVSRLRGASA